MSDVFVIRTGDRAEGVRELSRRFLAKAGKNVAVKANFNSADPYPASTHPDTLSALVDVLQAAGASVVLGERSGMGITRDVLFDLGIIRMSKKQGFDVVVLDGLKEWHRESPADSHWKRGFLFPEGRPYDKISG